MSGPPAGRSGGYQSNYRPGLFAGQVVLVTGGGSGIGRCICHELASLGALVLVLGRRGEKLDTVCAEVREDGGRADWAVCDIRDAEKVDAVIASFVAKHGAIDGLVNNAGGQFPSLLADMTARGFEAVVRNNLLGTFHMMQAVYRHAMRISGGAIVNITADHGGGFPGMGHTGAARAGVSNLTKTAAKEWAPDGVRVNEVAPGPIRSSGLDTYDEKMQETLAALPHHIPLKRMGTEAEVSAAVVFLLAPASSFVTGAQIRVDGGAPLGHSEFSPTSVRRTIPPFSGFHRSLYAQLPE